MRVGEIENVFVEGVLRRIRILLVNRICFRNRIYETQTQTQRRHY